MKRSGIFLRLLAVLALVGVAGVVAHPDGVIDLNPVKIPFKKTYDLKLGLDLQGGTHLVYEANMSGLPDDAQADALASVRDVIERRVNAFGVAEPLIQISGDNRLIVELPGVKDINEAINLIGQTPFLDFRIENPNPPDFTPDETGQVAVNPDDLFLPTELSGQHLERAVLEFDQTTGAPLVTLRFNSEGRQLFSKVTQENIGRRVAIFLDGEIISAPTVQAAITDGVAVITNIGALPEAKELVTRLNSGALPVPIALVSQQNVGATLGMDSLNKSIQAGIIGFIIVALYMLVYYRLPGLIAVVALVAYTIMSLAVFKLFGITLTLAGIAGFILSVGMAVDANILIFERLKEELRKGKSLNQAVTEGFARAWLSVRDSNTSSLITTFILAYFGTSLVRGFAITLAIGVLVSMFTAITFSRTMLNLTARIGFLNKTGFYGVSDKEHSNE